MRGLGLATGLAALLWATAAFGQWPITIDEAKLRAVSKGDSTVIVVPVMNSEQGTLHGTLELEWLRPTDVTEGRASETVTLARGLTTLEIPLPLGNASLWNRLRYKLTPTLTDARLFAPISGIVALPQLAAHVFELRVTQAGTPRVGRPALVHAQAVHPLTGLPVPGVRWKATLSGGEREFEPKQKRQLAGGVMEFAFDLPQAENLAVSVEAERGDFRQEADLTIDLNERASARIQTDKPIYQPGQTLQFRAIVLDGQGRALAGAPVALRIDDGNGGRVHTAQLTSSKFGIVSDTWTLPSTSDLGVYRLELSQQDERLGEHVVRVNRYELPTFRVTAKTDRSVYLAADPVKVTIAGAYLFGKPVPGGRVTITRQDSKEAGAEGVANADGSFTALLNVADDWDELKKREEIRFQDLHFAASYQDPSSGRTEQRRFDVRLSREPIHVYLTPGNQGQVYVSTVYADGQPAASMVTLRFQHRIVKLTTNRYGVGKAEWSASRIEVEAVDSAGLVGHHVEPWYPGEPSALRWQSGRTLYRAGEPVTLRLTSPADRPAEEYMVIYAVAGDQRVASRVAHLVNHRAEVTFPYQADFRRTVVFATATDDAAKTVVFPDGADLALRIRPDRRTYRPGESARMSFDVTSLDAKPVAAAIGVAIVDAAVLEHARTDTEFGQRPWFACAFCRGEGETEIGGIRLNDLYVLKTAITPELDLVAEALVARLGAKVDEESGESLTSAPRFTALVAAMEQVKLQIDRHYAETLEFPQKIEEFDRIALRLPQDPWGRALHVEFSVAGANRFVRIRSLGPDKLLGTPDDFGVASFARPYFAPLRRLILEALASQADYPANDAEFVALLRNQGMLFEALADPWGTPYRAVLRTLGISRQIAIRSAGPDRRFDTSDDVEIANFSGPYFRRESKLIAGALQKSAAQPRTVAEFEVAARNGGVDLASLRDHWNQPFTVVSLVSSHYGDRRTDFTEQTFGQPPRQRLESTPVTRKYITFTLRSKGQDAVEGTDDDFGVYSYPVVLLEEASAASTPPAVATRTLPGTGKILGVVKDTSGAVVGQAIVTLVDANGGKYQTATGYDGIFYFAAVPAGLYLVKAESTGFRNYVVTQVPVTDGQTTKLVVELSVGSLTQMVEVQAGAVSLQTESASVSETSTSTGTPRVREYFPETLLWLPELLTDASGAARAEVKLADSITTWKIAAVASTLDGRIVEAEGELRAFQPFFLDFAPPPVLTDGDQVTLPVTVRNYQNRAETVAVSLQPGDGFEIVGAGGAKVNAPANGSVNASFHLRAKGFRDEAKVRVIAKGARSQDATQKAFRVHPDGQEVSFTVGDLVTGTQSIPVAIRPGALPGATRGELRLYPNLAALLLESAGAILVMPLGCAEQTISAAYANLIAWRFARAAGVTNRQVEARAMANVRLAVESLAGFRSADQGIAYWRNRDPDVAVTALALSFLVDASSLVTVPPNDIDTLVAWLEQHLPKSERLAMLVARSLAAAKKAGHRVAPTSLATVYHLVATVSERTEEPYLLANFILAALDSGDDALIGDAALRLAKQAHAETGGLYWDLQSNSPFYGWGTAGRYESTGLVVAALAAWAKKHPNPELESDIRRGLYFLLRGRDHTGFWYSTQATLRSMQALTASSLAFGGLAGSTVQVAVNQRLVKTLTLPQDPNATDPIHLDLRLNPGANDLTLTPSGGGFLMQLTTRQWLPWTKPATTPAFRFSVTHNRQQLSAGELVRTAVKAERVGFRGYGMMLAEIGLPPGAEVDRGSLETAAVSHYEIRPDRVVVYLWPQAGGATFDFLWTPRFPMEAKSAPSVLYDYNNPESRAEVLPSLWRVR